MRIILVLAVTFGMAVAAGAQEDQCAAVGELAAAIMDGRQNGIVMSAAMAAYPTDKQGRELYVEMVKEAYGEPQWASDDRKSQAAIDFRNEAEFACYTAD